MSGENWTPGPWFVNPTPLADGRARVEDGRTNGLEAIKCEWSEAHLVAAAPELYEANKQAETVIETWLDAVHDQAREQLLDALESLHNAGAKAREEDT